MRRQATVLCTLHMIYTLIRGIATRICSISFVGARRWFQIGFIVRQRRILFRTACLFALTFLRLPSIWVCVCVFVVKSNFYLLFDHNQLGSGTRMRSCNVIIHCATAPLWPRRALHALCIVFTLHVPVPMLLRPSRASESCRCCSLRLSASAAYEASINAHASFINRVRACVCVHSNHRVNIVFVARVLRAFALMRVLWERWFFVYWNSQQYVNCV